jgi:hypothetical protein
VNHHQSKAEAYLLARAVNLDIARAEGVEIAPTRHSRGIYKRRLGFDTWNNGKDNLADLVIEQLWFACRDLKGEDQSYVLRPFPVLIGKDGEEVKFLNPKGHSYPWIPRSTWAARDKIKNPLFVTEGVPKALALLTAGVHSVSVPGVWMATIHREDGSTHLHPVLAEHFVFRGRVIYLVFDADYSTNAKVRQAIIRTAILFYKAGAELKLLTWPIAQGKGIDDYLAGKNSNGPEALKVLCEGAAELSAIIRPCDLEAVEMELLQARLKSTRLQQVCRMLGSALKVSPDELRDSVSAECNDVSRAFNLENPEPWPEPVSGEQVADEIVTILKKHVVMTTVKMHAITLWIFLTYAEAFVDCLPLLIIRSPEKRCGKSTLLGVLLRLVSKPLPTANITTAALYRVIEGSRPTILADEVDTWLKGNEEARGVIDSGHTRDFAFKILSNPNTLEPERFSTWAPKALAGIGKLADTLADRAITVVLERAGKNDSIVKLRDADPAIFQRLKQQLVRWALDHAPGIEESRPKLPTSDNHRELDNWFPMLQIADEIGDQWAARGRAAAIALSGGEDNGTIRTQVLAAIQKIYEETGQDCEGGFLPSTRITEELNNDKEATWADWKNGMTAKALASILSNFDVKSVRPRHGGEKERGYLWAHLQAHCEVYGSDSRPVASKNGDDPAQDNVMS